MSGNVIELNGKDFEKKIEKGNWIVDFWAEWCGPCKMMKPVITECAEEYKDKIKFGKVDVDSESEIAEENEIRSIPTLVFFKNGKQIDRISGYISKEELNEQIESVF